MALPEGWGLTSNGSHLIAGDGSATLYFIDPDTLDIVQTVQVGCVWPPAWLDSSFGACQQSRCSKLNP